MSCVGAHARADLGDAASMRVPAERAGHRDAVVAVAHEVDLADAVDGDGREAPRPAASRRRCAPSARARGATSGGRRGRSRGRGRRCRRCASRGMRPQPCGRSPATTERLHDLLVGQDQGDVAALAPEDARPGAAAPRPRRARRKSVVASACGNPVERAGMMVLVPHSHVGTEGSMSSIRDARSRRGSSPTTTRRSARRSSRCSEGLLDGARDGHELPGQLDQSRRRPGPGDHRVAQDRRAGGAQPRRAVRRAHQGALRGRPGLAGVHRRAELPAAARAPDGHRPCHQGRDRGRDRRDRALQPRSSRPPRRSTR